MDEETVLKTAGCQRFVGSIPSSSASCGKNFLLRWFKTPWLAKIFHKGTKFLIFSLIKINLESW